MRSPATRRNGPVVLLLALFSVMALGCQSAGERLTEAAAERALGAVTGERVDLDLNGGGMSLETDEGSLSFGATTTVPERIAAVVPVPMAFEPLQTFEQRDGEQRGVSVSGGLTDRSAVDVLDELEAALTADGWEVAGRTDINGHILSLHLERGDAAVNVNAVVEGDEALLTIMLLETE